MHQTDAWNHEQHPTNTKNKNANTSTLRIVFCDTNQTQLTHLTPIKQVLGDIRNLGLVK